MRTRFGTALLALTLTGCPLGTGVSSFRPANEPSGISVQLVSVQGAKMTGELLEVRDTALLVLADSQVRLAPFKAIRSASFAQRGHLYFGGGETPWRGQRLELQQLARFPAGVPPEAMGRLLQLCGQQEPKVVR